MGTGHQTDFDANAFGPFGPLLQAYVSTLENMGRTFGMPSALPSEFGPYAMSQHVSAPLKAVARCQLELFGLANRRTQAYMQVPTRMARCRTPQDVLNEQMAFWRTAAEQYGESSRKIFDAWASADAWHFPTDRLAERDYINFNGTGSKDTSARTTRPEQPGGKHRRVA